MAEKDSAGGGKKALIVSVLIVLLFGGGLFLFFIIEGAEDLRDDKTKNFSYGSQARSGVASFFKYIGFVDNEQALLTRQEKKVEGYFAVEKNAAALLEDWMLPEGGDAGEGASSGRGSAARVSAGESIIPRLGMKGFAQNSASGGSSKSSAEFSGFRASGAGKDMQVAKRALPGFRSGAVQRGTLSDLKASLGFLGEGLRSGSASSAKAGWDKSFGAGPAGRGESASYSGRLVGLDRIKSGEIASLKNTERKGLALPDVGAPVRDEEAEKGDPVLEKAKEAVKDAANPAKGLTNSIFSPVADAAGSSMYGNTAGNRAGDKSGEPEMSQGVSSIVNSYGAPNSVNHMSGVPADCQDVGLECPSGYWKVEYADGTWASFAMTTDKDDNGNPVPLVFDQCLSVTACKK